jgi:hypothetical protein
MDYVYYQRDGFLYRRPEPVLFSSLRQMERWTGEAWEPVASEEQVDTVMYASRVDAETAQQIVSA